MKAPNDAKLAKAYLEELCDRIERKESLRRPRKTWWVFAAPMAVGLMVACGSTEDDDGGGGDAGSAGASGSGGSGGTSATGGTGGTSATGGTGGTGGASGEAGAAGAGALYAAPQLEDCYDGVDNDGDSKVDCEDEDCFAAPMCTGVDYAAPPEDCSDGVDNDFDGKVDCDDEDCAGFPACGGDLYAAP